MRPLKNHYLVEIPLPTISNGQRYYLGDIPELRQKRTMTIESYTEATLAFSPAQRVMISTLGCANLLLTLCEESTENYFQIPYLSLFKTINGGLRTEIADKVFNLPKSYLTLLNVANVTANEAACISFWYL